MGGLVEGKVAIVTGGGWNIGRAVAERLAREGARVAICGRRVEPLEETAAAIRAEGGEVLVHPGDVTVLDQMHALAARTLESFGAIDSLLALAGGGGTDETTDAIDPAWWESVVRVNLVGSFHAVRAVLPTLRAHGSGTIVTCSGGGAWFPGPGCSTAYASAKAGLCRFTDQLALELWGTGIRVNALQPGPTWSAQTLRTVEEEERASGTPHPQRAANRPPEEAAELAVWLASEASAPLTGRSVASTEDWWRDRATVEAVAATHHAYCLRRQELA